MFAVTTRVMPKILTTKRFFACFGLIIRVYWRRGAGARAKDTAPNPPQVSVDFYYPPSPLIQDGRPRLVYEMRLGNYPPITFTPPTVPGISGAPTIKKF